MIKNDEEFIEKCVSLITKITSIKSDILEEIIPEDRIKAMKKIFGEMLNEENCDNGEKFEENYDELTDEDILEINAEIGEVLLWLMEQIDYSNVDWDFPDSWFEDDYDETN